MLRRSLLIMFLLFLFLSLIAPTFAQDATPEPAATAIVTPAPVVTPVPTSDPADRTIFVVGFIVVMAYIGIKDFLADRRVDHLIETANRVLSNKEFRDDAHERYVRSSLEVQEFVKLMQGIAGFAGSLNLPVVDPLIDKTKETLDDITASAGAGVSQSTFHIYAQDRASGEAAARELAEGIERGLTQ